MSLIYLHQFEGLLYRVATVRAKHLKNNFFPDQVKSGKFFLVGQGNWKGLKSLGEVRKFEN